MGIDGRVTRCYHTGAGQGRDTGAFVLQSLRVPSQPHIVVDKAPVTSDLPRAVLAGSAGVRCDGGFVMRPNQPADFWARVQKGDGCWAWLGYVDANGYGLMKYQGPFVRAHRLAYELAIGPIPPGPHSHVLHHCDNRSCVRPDHLFLGDDLANARDREMKGRGAHGLRNGAYTHPERRPVGDRHGSRIHIAMRHRGSAHSEAKLTEAAVIEIHHQYKGGVTKAALSRRFGVSAPVIANILKGTDWAHVYRALQHNP